MLKGAPTWRNRAEEVWGLKSLGKSGWQPVLRDFRRFYWALIYDSAKKKAGRRSLEHYVLLEALITHSFETGDFPLVNMTADHLMHEMGVPMASYEAAVSSYDIAPGHIGIFGHGPQTITRWARKRRPSALKTIRDSLAALRKLRLIANAEGKRPRSGIHLDLSPLVAALAEAVRDPRWGRPNREAPWASLARAMSP